MREALELAAKASGETSPNPMVGAVIVKGEQVLARGYHRRAGLPHAEVEALLQLDGKAPGATVYVNLEPCAHVGRTGPCTDALIEAQVARVVVAVQDPDERVNGRGLRRLEAAGIEVSVGVLEEEARELNAGFFCFVQKKRPLVSLKVAASVDGKIATHQGDARWLSGEQARRWGHSLRASCDAILVGRGTVEADDPALTVRLVEGRDPLRVVLDSSLQTPLASQLYGEELAARTVVFCTDAAPEARRAVLEERGVRVFVVSAGGDGRVPLEAVLSQLHALDCLHLMVEGGGQIHGAFLQARLVDRLYCVLTPWLVGEDGVSAFSFPSPALLSQAMRLEGWTVEPLGADFLMCARPVWPEEEASDSS